MNTWVEWWDNPVKKSGSHAQMSVNLTIAEEPDPKKINRRFFDTQKGADTFAKIMIERGYHAVVKHDRSETNRRSFSGIVMYYNIILYHVSIWDGWILI
jgi:hypothetical protein